jgi:predicted MFS family arabinose efflux permease
VILIAVAPSLIFLALAVAACGLWIAPLLTMRNLILGRLLPASQLSEGFSTLSAAGQVGYGASGIATGIVLGFAGVRACFLTAAAVTIASALGAWLLHQHRRGSQADQPAEPPESHR